MKKRLGELRENGKFDKFKKKDNKTCYILRNGNLSKLTVEGYVVDCTGKERPKMEYTSQIPKDTGMKSCRELKNPSLDREARKFATNRSKD